MHRTADYDTPAEVPKLSLSSGTKLAQDDRNEILQRVLLSEYICLAKQPTGQMGLQGLHQTPPAVGSEIASNSARPCHGLQLTVRGAAVGVEVQHGPEGRGAMPLRGKARECC